MTNHIKERSLHGADRVIAGLDELWDEEMEVYVMRLTDGEKDHRIDAAARKLTDALQAYDELDDV